ncbi:uncharacterized protein LODBEIA_P27210 [Lodderomyces beijingensis]|uniref:Geranylgeranyl transferase type-2 subunit alpha n=1 Tax=Lodderomyces beijingensis TaxID=1775926 RepID=A0ABP0ZMB0_9ASCO
MQHEVKRAHLTEEQLLQKYEKDKPKIAHYNELTAYLFEQRQHQIYNEQTLQFTTSLLKLNPEFYTMWNYRREIMHHMYSPTPDIYVRVLNDELNFVLASLKRFPKVYWIWNHRSWCLFKLVELKSVNWEFEFKTVSKMLELDQRNFHGWHYRRFVVENLELEQQQQQVESGGDKNDGKGDGDDNSNKLAILQLNFDEFDYTTSKIQRDFSNFSAWHNRTKLIPKIFHLLSDTKSANETLVDTVDKEKLELFKTPLSILHNDLAILRTGIYMSPEDNSVWLYLYWLLSDDFFVSAFETREKYLEILNDQLSLIHEVNDLEKDDTGSDNVGCLKSLVYVHALIDGVKGVDVLDDANIVSALQKLVQLDSLRKHRYEDQLSGKAPVI